MIEKLHYPKDILEVNYEKLEALGWGSTCNSVVWDIKKHCLLKLDHGAMIVEAIQGYERLDEISI